MAARNKPAPLLNTTTEYMPLINLALLGVLKFNRYFTQLSMMNNFSLNYQSKNQDDISYFQADKLIFIRPADIDAKDNTGIANAKAQKTLMNISLFLRLLYTVISVDVRTVNFIGKYTMNFRSLFIKNSSYVRFFGDMLQLFTNDENISKIQFIFENVYLNEKKPVAIGEFSQTYHDQVKTVLRNIGSLTDLFIQELVRNAKVYKLTEGDKKSFHFVFTLIADEVSKEGTVHLKTTDDPKKIVLEKISGVTRVKLSQGDIIINWDNWPSVLRILLNNQDDPVSSVKQEPVDNSTPFIKQEPVDDIIPQQPSSSTDNSPFSQPSRPSRGTTNTGLSGYSRNEEPRVLRSSKEKDDLIEKLKNQVRQLQVTSSKAITLKNENNTLEKKITALEEYISCLKRNSDCISGGFFVFTDIIPNKEAYYAAWESNFMYYISFLVYIAVIRYSDKFKPFESVIQSAKTLIDFARSNASPDPVDAINSLLTFFDRFYSILEEIYSTNDIFKKDQEKEKFFTTIRSPPYSFYLSPRFVLKLNRALEDNDVLIVRQYCLVELVYTITRLNYWKELENQRPFEYLYTKYFQQNAIPTFVAIIAKISKIKQYQSFVRQFEIPKPENRIKIFQKQFNEPVCNEPFFLQQSSSPQPSSSSESLSDD